MDFAENTLIGLLGVSSNLAESVLEIVPGAEYNPLQAKLHREASKLLAWFVLRLSFVQVYQICKMPWTVNYKRIF